MYILYLSSHTCTSTIFIDNYNIRENWNIVKIQFGATSKLGKLSHMCHSRIRIEITVLLNVLQ